MELDGIKQRIEYCFQNAVAEISKAESTHYYMYNDQTEKKTED